MKSLEKEYIKPEIIGKEELLKKNDRDCSKIIVDDVSGQGLR